eukprot:765749-Hanusia_phi.AAC.2
MLIEMGANLDAQTDDGDTPLHYAGIKGLDQIATELVLAGANPCVQNYEGFIKSFAPRGDDKDVRQYEESRFDHRTGWEEAAERIQYEREQGEEKRDAEVAVLVGHRTGQGRTGHVVTC